MSGLSGPRPAEKDPAPYLTRTVAVRAGSFDEASHTIDVVWSTGAPVRRYSPFYDVDYDEHLVMTAEAVDLSRLNAGAPFLDTHNNSTLGAVLGSVVPGSAAIRNGHGVAKIRLSRAESVAESVEKIREGHARSISVGYRIKGVRRLQHDHTDVETWEITRWEPFEISAVPIPADAGAHIRAEQSISTRSFMEEKMTAYAAPRSRETNDTARATAIEGAILHRAGTIDDLPAGAEAFRNLTLLEAGKEFLEGIGRSTRGMSRTELARELLTRRGYSASSDFTVLLANVANKSLRAAYDAAPQTWRAFARIASAKDFKPVSRVMLGEAPQLEKVGENGEYKRGTLKETATGYRVETFGKVISFTRQALINDDLNAFGAIPRAFGIAAATLESDLVWGLILANGIMVDGKPLFHADHGNVAAPTALSVAGIAAMRTLMGKQVGLDGKTRLNIRPRHLIVPTELETAAEQILHTTVVPNMPQNGVPASMKSLNLIAEPRLSDVSATAFYLAADPNIVDTVELAYLEGQDGVYTETRSGFDMDGLEIKARLDVGAAVIDWRGLARNAGA